MRAAWRSAAILRRQAWSPFAPEPVEFVKLNFDFHPRTMLNWLRAAGLMPQQIRALSSFRLGLVGLDALLQPTGQWLQYSPSIFVRATADSTGQPAPAGQFFRCPACGSSALSETPEALACGGCGKAWPVADGIYDFRGVRD